MAYLSRDDLDNFAEQILCGFVKAEYPKGHLCYNVDPTRLAQFYGYNILFVPITRDGSILGQTSTGKMWTSIIDASGNDIFFFLDGQTILIDERLANDPTCYGRRNFTIAHELAHQFINRAYPEVYGSQTRIICDYRRSVRPHKEITDWREWQADAMAASLLLPREAIEEATFTNDTNRSLFYVGTSRAKTWLDIVTTISQEALANAITGDDSPRKRPQAVKAVRDALCVKIGTSGDLTERNDLE